MNNEKLAKRAEKDYPLPDRYKWGHGGDWVGISNNEGDVWYWWAYTTRRGASEERGMVFCRKGESDTRCAVAHLENVEDAIPLMATKLMLGMWE